MDYLDYPRKIDKQALFDDLEEILNEHSYDHQLVNTKREVFETMDASIDTLCQYDNLAWYQLFLVLNRYTGRAQQLLTEQLYRSALEQALFLMRVTAVLAERAEQARDAYRILGARQAAILDKIRNLKTVTYDENRQRLLHYRLSIDAALVYALPDKLDEMGRLLAGDARLIPQLRERDGKLVLVTDSSLQTVNAEALGSKERYARLLLLSGQYELLERWLTAEPQLLPNYEPYFSWLNPDSRHGLTLLLLRSLGKAAVTSTQYAHVFNGLMLLSESGNRTEALEVRDELLKQDIRTGMRKLLEQL